jgi:predicted permease
MRAILAMLRRLGGSFGRDRWDRDFSDEIQSHIQLHIDEKMRSGMPFEDARHDAMLRFGGVARVQESYRDRRMLPFVENTMQDLRYAVRALRSSPAFAVVAVLSLGLGIGANTAIFGLVNSVLLKSLPVTRPEELVRICMRQPSDARDGEKQSVFTNPLWEAIRGHGELFEGVFAHGRSSLDLAAGGPSRLVGSNWVSGGYFITLGVQPALGRLIVPDDDRRGCAGVAVLSYEFWRSEYGGNPDVLALPLRVEGHPVQIIGVAQNGFRGLEVGSPANLFMPLCAIQAVRGESSGLDNRSMWWLHVMARLKPGARIEQVEAGLNLASRDVFNSTVPPNWRAGDQDLYKKRVLYTWPGSQGLSWLRNQYRRALLILMAGVGLVLLIACANVANLLLARAAARQREMAIRLALGSARSRLIRQLLTESLLLAGAGALLGSTFAFWGSSALVRLLCTSSDTVFLDLTPDWRMLGFTIAVAVATGILFGLAPAWRSSGVRPDSALKAGARGVIEGHRRLSAGKALVALQVALSLVLLVGAGLLLSTLQRLVSVHPGFDAARILIVTADLRSSPVARKHPDTATADILAHLRVIPGVSNASASSITPVSNWIFNDEVTADGYTPKSREDSVVYFNLVSDRYFEAMGTPLLAGRDFDRGDTPKSRLVAIVNEAFSRKVFGGFQAVGRKFQTHRPDGALTYEIVGLAGNSKYNSLRENPEPIAYIAAAQDPPRDFMAFEIRTPGAPAAMIPAVTRALAGYDPSLTFRSLPLSLQLADSLQRDRLLSTLSGVFGWLALTLAAIGLYGLMSYNVARRRGEIGVRIALGAERRGVQLMIMRDAAMIVALGISIGVPASLASTGVLRTFLFGIDPTDARVIAAAALLLVFVAMLSGYLPARRASRLDPMLALREE